MQRYERTVESKRRPGQRRIEVFSPKIKRRLTLFSRDSHDAWLLLEADPTVRAFCERPAYVDGEAGRVLDFWVDQGTHSRFWALSSSDTESESLPRTAHGVSLRVLRRPDTIAFAMRIQNWAQIVPYRISFLRHSEPSLQIAARNFQAQPVSKLAKGHHGRALGIISSLAAPHYHNGTFCIECTARPCSGWPLGHSVPGDRSGFLGSGGR
jgi:hypothetical protein